MKHAAVVLCSSCAALASCAWLLLARTHARREHRSSHKRTRSTAKFNRTMCEREYVALIPPHELKPLRKLLRAIHAEAGWSTEPGSLDAAWEQVLHAAGSPDGGAWDSCIGEGQLCPEGLYRLSVVIDRVLLGGALQEHLLGAGRKQVGFQVVEEAPGPDDWISYYDEKRNDIVLRKHRWGPASLEVTEERPMSCEGLICTSNLQVLAHTLAHEMVHALVYNIFPEIDAASEAYLPDERHGPIFKLLNKQLFGHSIDSLRQVFRIGQQGL